MDYLEIAKQSIDYFPTEEEKYQLNPDIPNLNIKGDGHVYLFSPKSRARINVNFVNGKGSRVFIGWDTRGDITIQVRGSNSFIYIGHKCRLFELEIRSFQDNDFIAIGNHVTTTSQNKWISGSGVKERNTALIVGDDCMFAHGVVIRNSDAHPVFNIKDDHHPVNFPKEIVHVEPHVWLGEKATVLKDVTIGACSIIGLGSIVTKDIPRFSIAKGSPAEAVVNPDLYWSRHAGPQAKAAAKAFARKYRSIEKTSDIS